MAETKIPPVVKKKYPELVEMILASPSMDENERNYWLSMLVIMTQEQVNNLKDILVSEKEKLAGLKKAKEETKTLANDGKFDEAKARVAEEKRSMVERKEKEHEAMESKEEENLLQSIQNL